MKYYWLKLPMNFYEEPEIKWLLKQESGTKYVVFYQMLCMLAGRYDSNIVENHVADFTEPYTDKDYAEMCGFSTDTIMMAKIALMQVHLIQLREDKRIVIPGMSKMIGKESDRNKRRGEESDKAEHKRELARIRKRRQRERERLLASAEVPALPEGSVTASKFR